MTASPSRALSLRGRAVSPVPRAEDLRERTVTHSGATIIPIRAFTGGKSRLAPHLSRRERCDLLRWMAERVVEAARPFDTAIVTSAIDVRSWALDLGLVAIPDPGTLNLAARAGLDWAQAAGVERAVVVHADLPLAQSLHQLYETVDPGEVLAVRSRTGSGTPALSLPTQLPFRFNYGEGSFARHREEASRLGAPFRELVSEQLAHDVDTQDDLAALPRHIRALPAVAAGLGHPARAR